MVPRFSLLFNLKQKGRSELRPLEYQTSLQTSGYASAANGPHDEGQDKQDEEDKEEELGDACRRSGDAAKTKQCGHNSQHKERECPTEHGNLHYHA